MVIFNKRKTTISTDTLLTFYIQGIQLKKTCWNTIAAVTTTFLLRIDVLPSCKIYLYNRFIEYHDDLGEKLMNRYETILYYFFRKS